MTMQSKVQLDQGGHGDDALGKSKIETPKQRFHLYRPPPVKERQRMSPKCFLRQKLQSGQRTSDIGYQVSHTKVSRRKKQSIQLVRGTATVVSAASSVCRQGDILLTLHHTGHLLGKHLLWELAFDSMA